MPGCHVGMHRKGFSGGALARRGQWGALAKAPVGFPLGTCGVRPFPSPHASHKSQMVIIPFERTGAPFHLGEHNKSQSFTTKLGWTTLLSGRKAITDHDNEIVQKALKMLMPHLYTMGSAYSSDTAADLRFGSTE